MVNPRPPSFPWIHIPPVAQTGQVRAFADREDQIAQLYKALVGAGNAVRDGESTVRHRFVVSGYTGVGKSALILQVLAMLRDELGVVDGQRLTLPPDLPEPDGRERWLILRASGKQVPSVDSIAEALRKCALSIFDDVQEEAERRLPGVLELPLLHRLLRRREARLFQEVSAALKSLAAMIDYVQVWQGSTLKIKLESQSHAESSRNIEADLAADLRRLGGEPTSAEAKAALKLAAGFIRKRAMSTHLSTTLEQQSVVGAELVVEALNQFFVSTDRAGIPTILVLDDFDEFASNVGPSHAQRSQVLSSVLGEFSRLKPTCLIIGLREEYLHEDVLRQYQNVHIPPLTRTRAAEILDAWSAVQRPPLDAEIAASLRAIGDKLLDGFEMEEQVVIPFRFLQLVSWIANNITDCASRSRRELVQRYLRTTFGGEVVDAMDRVCMAMPDGDIRRCAEVRPVDPEPYAEIGRYERLALARLGLLRPVIAGDPDDSRIVLDPLCAYLRPERAATPA